MINKCYNEAGDKDGESVSYYKNGEIESKGFYLNKLKHGYWEYYWYTGQLRSCGQYNNGEYDGVWKEYFDGRLHSVNMYKQGKREGEWESYFSNRLLNWKGQYKNDKEEGEWIFYDIYGNISEKGNYSNGQRIGIWQEGAHIVSHYNDGQRVAEVKNEELIEKTTIEAQQFFWKYLTIGLLLISLLLFLLIK